ncbi:MAG: hypothetical protein ACRCYO_19440 [Bacteroidia bacterium]
MQKLRALFSLILLVGFSSCFNTTKPAEPMDSLSAEEYQKLLDEDSVLGTGTTTTNTTENMNEWIDEQGIKIRRLPEQEAAMTGKEFVWFDSYNSGGGSGGYSSESHMTLCANGQVSTYEQSQTSVYVEGMDGSSASEDSDSGTWEVYEDASGNLFLKLNMKKGGAGFVNFAIKDGKLLLGGRSYHIKAAGC